MPLDFKCPHCQRPIRPTAEQRGELVACPHCRKQVPIPADDTRDSPKAQSADPGSPPPTTIWHVQTEDGKQYGPVTGELLQVWYEEGRITADCQLLRKGSGQWQWATDVYPELDPAAEHKPVGPKEAAPARPRKPEVRAAPVQSATQITPLSPSDFPTTGSGLKSLGPVIRPLPPGYEEPRFHSEEALEDRRKYAPFMVAHMDRPPLHKMLIVVAIANFAVGSLRAVLYFILFLFLLAGIGTLGENPDQKLMARAAVSLALAFLMLVLNITIISAGIGLLQQRDWGRTATYAGTLIGMVVQLTGLCVTMMLGAEGSGLARMLWIWLLILLMPSILFDAFAAAALSVPSVVEDLEE